MNSPQSFARSELNPESDRMPRPAPRGVEQLTSMDSLHFCYSKFKKGEDTYPTRAQRRVLGIGLPVWQRPLKWTEEHMVGYITSCWQNRNVGHWIINVLENGPDELDGLLIDGQQRLTSVERYFDNRLAIPGVDGAPLLWQDLSIKEQRRFLRTPMPAFKVSYTDENELRRLSDLLNYSGVAHTDEDRAIRIGESQ